MNMKQILKFLAAGGIGLLVALTGMGRLEAKPKPKDGAKLEAEQKIKPRKVNVKYLEPKIDSIAEAGIRGGAYPGCQFVVLQNGKTVLDKCYGVHSERTPLPVKPTDLYDLASVTKSTATLMGVMRLYEEGKLDLNQKASYYLPFYRGTDKEDITVHDLLMHESGLKSWITFFYQAIDPATAASPLLVSKKDSLHQGQIDANTFISTKFEYRPGAISAVRDSVHTMPIYFNMWLDKSYIDTLRADIVKSPYTGKHYGYSDCGFISLQWIVEALTGRSLDDYIENEFYAPMGIKRTMFLPARRYPLNEIVPTCCDDCLRKTSEICGYTQDEMAAFMGGVAGEAGLFSTAEDLARIYQMYLDGGVAKGVDGLVGEGDAGGRKAFGGKRLFKKSTIERFTTERSKISHRGLGFDRPNLKKPNESACVTDVPKSSYGHGGFTGTNVWVDPDNQLVYVFLCNRVSPYPWNSKLDEMDIFKKMQKAIYESMKK
jgi:CubicO group peptidase (beta-lactamase class C family)